MIKLNLLPPKEKKEAKLASFAHWLMFFVFPISIFLIIFILFLVSTLFSLFIITRAQEDAIKTWENDFKNQELLKIEEKIIETNQILDRVYYKQKEAISWTLVFEEISEIIPKEAYLTNFSYNKNMGTINLIGWAKERKDILFMEKLLKESLFFEQVNSPLSNLLKQNDIDFSFNFKPVLSQ